VVWVSGVTSQVPALKYALKFALLSGLSLTSDAWTVVNGDICVSPGTTMSGSPQHVGGKEIGTLTDEAAQTDLTDAWTEAKQMTGGVDNAAQLGGVTLTSGIYKINTALDLSCAPACLSCMLLLRQTLCVTHHHSTT
jgi:hypothetical protein